MTGSAEKAACLLGRLREVNEGGDHLLAAGQWYQHECDEGGKAVTEL